MTHINPLRDIGTLLNSVQNPVRYLGGEFGSFVKDTADFTFAIAFPDLYEIAMCNQAVKIIYNGLNRIDSVRCERVFAPAPDFEALLKSLNLPLYTLESGIPLHETDVVGFSIGYELGINGVLSILQSGGIPLEASKRSNDDPIILAGGCGVTNPAPFGRFFDAVFIGEAEPGLFDLVRELSEMKQAGARRPELLERIVSHPSVWISGKTARKAVFADFGVSSDATCFPVPNIRVVQDHGVVEIMRGCPNGCRFCHAGVYYRPQRMKDPESILREVDYIIHKAGYREISLNSLSSGDYPDINMLLDTLNSVFSDEHVSFQMPSLKVNTFTLPVLEKLAEVRKSGLTFAIETPVDMCQLSLNKEVFKEKVIDIILHAKKRGWNKAKFYFMVGLPFDGISEEKAIVDFMLEVQERTCIQCNVNVGTFIPKAHTPYERVAQISIEEATRKLEYVRFNLPRKFFKVSTHIEFNSFLEGMLSRGDERVSSIILSAFGKGCRLDPWEDFMKPELWKAAIEEAPWNVYEETYKSRAGDERLPWADVKLGPSDAFFTREYKRSCEHVLTKSCTSSCAEPCGVCNKDHSIRITETASLDWENAKHYSSVYIKSDKRTEITADVSESGELTVLKSIHNIPVLYRAIVSFRKENAFAFVPHLGLLETWNKTLLRSGLPVHYTAGYNPLPRLEFATSLSIGITSEDEVASCLFLNPVTENEVISSLQTALPEGLKINRVFVFPVTNLKKRESLASGLWGSEYTINFIDDNTANSFCDFIESIQFKEFIENQPFNMTGRVLSIRLPFKKDRAFRDLVSSVIGRNILEVAQMRKIKTLALWKNTGRKESVDKDVTDYFGLYESIAAENRILLENAGISF